MDVGTKSSIFSGGIAGLGTMLTAWLGGWDAALRALVVFMVLDYLTGFLAAAKARRLNSEVMFWGGIRKAIILVVVMLGVLLDGLVGNTHPIFRTVVIYFYIAREGLSVTENLGLLGVPLPQFLVMMLEQLGSAERK
jgi:toxin secretion/phage lysis holin